MTALQSYWEISRPYSILTILNNTLGSIYMMEYAEIIKKFDYETYYTICLNVCFLKIEGTKLYPH